MLLILIQNIAMNKNKQKTSDLIEFPCVENNFEISGEEYSMKV